MTQRPESQYSQGPLNSTYVSGNMYEPGHHKESVVSIAPSVSSSGSGGSVSTQPTVRIVDTVMALYSYSSDKPHSLAFKRGDTIYVLTKLGSGWWEGVLASGHQGWFPSNYTQSLPVASATTQQVEQQQQFLHPYNQGSQTSHASSITSTTTSGADFTTEYSTTASTIPGTSVHNGVNTPLFLQTGSAMGFDVDEDSSSSSVIAANSRKGSVVSYGSSTNDVEQQMAPHTEFLDGYRSVDTREPTYHYPPNYWIPQISNTGKLLYVNTTSKHISNDLPFERIDPNFAEQEEQIPTSVPAPPDLVENTRMAMVDDKKILDESLKAFAIVSLIMKDSQLSFCLLFFTFLTSERPNQVVQILARQQGATF
jgi:son of sevenless